MTAAQVLLSYKGMGKVEKGRIARLKAQTENTSLMVPMG